MNRQLFIPAAAALSLASACAAMSTSPADKCAVNSIEEIVSNAASLAGKVFCGEAFIVKSGRTARILRGADDISPFADLAMLVSSESRGLLVGLSETPKRFYIEAELDPMIECFEPSASGEECSPYRRPVVFHIRSVQ